MNKRIRELLAQAGVQQVERFDAIDGSNQLHKFAELIVQECTKVCAPIPGLPFSAEIESARYGCAKDIKKHFGVEE